MPRRSRRCQECRQRRIGCDNGQPSCRQCVLTNRRCSGSVQGHIFVDQTTGVTSRYGRALIPSEMRNHSMPRQPSPRNLLSLGLVSEFISSSTAMGDSPSKVAWLCGIGHVSLKERGSALDLSMQAVAFAYYGIWSKRKEALIESSRLYGEAMVQHSRAISKHTKDPDTAMIYTSVALSLFEVIKSPKNPAYAIHLTAARKMIDSAEWDVLQNGLHRDIAIHVQHQTLLMTIISPLDYVGVNLATEFWTHKLWVQSGEPLPVVDRLKAQMFVLWRIIRSETRDAHSEDVALHLDNIGSTVKGIWDDYQRDATIYGEVLQYESSGETVYRDGPTALIIAFFATTQLMLSQADAIATSHCSQTSGDHCETILRCASYLIRRSMFVGCPGFSMILPLNLVASYGTSSRYRKMAHNILESQSKGALHEAIMSNAL